jgi:hypothetical protein
LVTVDSVLDYLGLFGLAAALGGIGGVAYELMRAHRGETGFTALPRRATEGKRQLENWGVFANIFIGAVAAVAALWIFPPTTTVTAAAAGGAGITKTSYDVVKVVGLSLIIGSAGSSFLSAMQARALALVKQQEATTTRAVASAQIDAIAAHASGGGAEDTVAVAVDFAKKALAATAVK